MSHPPAPGRHGVDGVGPGQLCAVKNRLRPSFEIVGKNSPPAEFTGAPRLTGSDQAPYGGTAVGEDDNGYNSNSSTDPTATHKRTFIRPVTARIDDSSCRSESTAAASAFTPAAPPHIAARQARR